MKKAAMPIQQDVKDLANLYDIKAIVSWYQPSNQPELMLTLNKLIKEQELKTPFIAQCIKRI